MTFRYWIVVGIMSYIMFWGEQNIYAQVPDLTSPEIYEEVIPGMKDITKENTKKEDNKSQKKSNLEKKDKKPVNSQKTSFLTSLKEIFQNKTIVNLILLTIIFLIFIIYRLRR